MSRTKPVEPPKEERLHLLVPPPLKARVEQAAEERGLTLSAYVRRVLMGLEPPPGR